MTSKNNEIAPSHVAVLVPSVRRAADYLRRFKFEIGEEEDFEETREVYVEGSEKNSLLLMEPKGAGSYQRALQKRGPGIHHLAIDVLDLEKFVDSLSGSGWLLHLNSLKTLKGLRTIYLARPGFPALIEVHEKKKLLENPLFVQAVSLKLHPDHAVLIKAVGLEQLLNATNEKPFLTLKGQRIELEKLFT